MMFLIRSAFWLSVVFSAMPFERSEIARVIDQAKGGLAGDAVSAAKQECADNASACDALAALLIAASRGDGPTAEDRAALERIIAAGADGAKEKTPRASYDSLTPEDRAIPWRGRKVKSAA